jgi:hypothetical protein
MEQFGITEKQLHEEFSLDMILKILKYNELRAKQQEVEAKKAKLKER